jgi:hypothetical protein
MHEHSSNQSDPVVAAVGVEFDENDVPSPSSKEAASPLAEAHSAWSSENLPAQFLSTLGLWNKERVKELTDR